MISSFRERTSLEDRLIAALSGGVLIVIAAVVFGRALRMIPLSDDNLYILDWANRTPLRGIIRSDPDFYPEWRPLAYLSVWVQYHWAGITSASQYFAVNVLLWIAVAWLVRQIVVDLTGSPFAGLFAGALLLADVRVVHTITWIIERQASMACLFGLLAMRLYLVRHERGLSPPQLAWMALLLVASGLSKEFGLAFAVSIALMAALTRRWTVSMAAVAALLCYAALRLTSANGAASKVCEEMGFFNSLRTVCFVPVTPTAIAQGAYNIVAAGLDSLLPGLFSGDGRIAIAWTHLPASAAWLALAMSGWASRSRMLRAMTILLPISAVFNFMLYRDRNHLAGLCVVAIAAGVGLAKMRDRGVRERAPARTSGLNALALASVALLLTVQLVQTRRVVAAIVDGAKQTDPCETLGDFPRLEAAFVARAKNAYAMNNPGCAGF